MPSRAVRRLVIVLGDQLDRGSSALDGFDAAADVVWMAEVAEEATHVWSHKARIAVFLAAMRHFRDAMVSHGYRFHYRQLDDADNQGSLAAELRQSIRSLRPKELVVAEPGDWRVREALRGVAAEAGLVLEIRRDRHFLSTVEQFAAFAAGRKQLRMEHFYRQLRREHQVLMQDGEPVGGQWNYDADNRGAFGKQGPGLLPEPVGFPPDATTRAVLALVESRFAAHPGRLTHFDWPVTPEQGQACLADFIAHRLPVFGEYQDAMWTQQPYLYHSRLSVALNLKLLDPRDVLRAAEQAYARGDAPLAAVEGFVRQILGWREYVRGVYWLRMPGYAEVNALEAKHPLPGFYWTGETDMACLHHVITQTLEYGYAHHIQRLMVTGLYALLFGVEPKLVHEWYLAVYVDAVEWVELPNTIGMSQYADGGLLGSKPYAATGKYIQRMSNYCAGCRYDPADSTGERACPVTTLYWDFLLRHRARLSRNPRMGMQVRNLDRLAAADQKAIRDQARRHRLHVLDPKGTSDP